MKRLSYGKYSKEFRIKAVELAENGLGVMEAARSLSLPPTTLATWLKAYREGSLSNIGEDQTQFSEHEIELSCLNRELTRIKSELTKVKIEKERINRDSKVSIYFAERNSSFIEFQKMKRVYDFLYESCCSEEEIKKLALKFGFSLSEAKKYKKNAQKLMNMIVKRSGGTYLHDMAEDPRTGERIFCPEWPTAEEESDFFINITVRLWKLISVDAPDTNTINAINYYINRTWKSSKHLHFLSVEKDGEAAKNYIKFLSNIGIKKERLFLVNYDLNFRSTYRAAWRNLLGIARRFKIYSSVAEEKYFDRKRQYLGIGVLAPEDITTRLYSSNQTSKAFHFLMKMAYIYIGR